MSIYFNTNLTETRGLLAFTRTNNKISTILNRLETGYRINSAKDDPVGLVTRETMRADIKGMQAALNNTASTNTLMSTLDSGMANIAKLLTGDPDEKGDTGLVGLLRDDSASMSQILQVLNSIDTTARMTSFNGQEVLNGSLAYRTSGFQSSDIGNLDITAANLASGPKAVTVSVAESADQARIGFAFDETGTGITEGMSLTIAKEGEKAVTYTFADGITKVGKDAATDVMAAADLAAELTAALSGSGIKARVADSGEALLFESENYGSDENISVYFNDDDATNALVLASYDASETLGDPANTVTGKDAVVNVNGMATFVRGLEFDYSSSDLALKGTISTALNTAKGDTSFNVTGGGTTFQLGKDVNPLNQLRFGLTAVNTSTLGGGSGVLDDIRSLNLNSADDKAKALDIVQEAIVSLSNTRGRIGSTQKYVLDVNTENLENQISLTTDAEARISNTDVALETSRLARQELIAESAMNSILYSRQFASFAVASLF